MLNERNDDGAAAGDVHELTDLRRRCNTVATSDAREGSLSLAIGAVTSRTDP
jgi:hypothetical protein